MILLVDWGNTFLKTLIVEDDITEQSKLDSKHLYQSSSIEEFSEYILHVNTHPETKISTAYISSVRKTSDNQSLILILEQLEIDSKLTKTTRELSGVVCAYKQFESFGGDRWLAVIAAYSPKKTTGIIDIGSAITLDIVDKQGMHLGGQIVPGRKLLLESLKATDRVIFSDNENFPENVPLLGASTNECVEYGLEQMLKSYLLQSIQTVTKQHNVERWIFTGGGGQYWANKLNIDIDFTFDAFLIFRGLIKFKNQLRKN